MSTSALVYSASSSAQGFLSHPFESLIIDAITLFVAYGVNFIGCDLLYHNFRIREACKGSFWFILGPFLYIFGPGLLWVDAWIKAIIAKEKNKIIDKLKGSLPGWLVEPVSFVAGRTIFSDKAIQQQKENLEYLYKIGRLQQ